MQRANDAGTNGARRVLDGYARLLRRQLGRLLRPLLRLHSYRDASTRMWRRAMCRLDCGQSGGLAGRNC